MKKIFVSDFEDRTTEEDLAWLFSDYGPVLRVSMRTGKLRRYAIITMSDAAAERAIEAVDRKKWRTAWLDVKESNW
jgi:RNA recognition motif-containing protein